MVSIWQAFLQLRQQLSDMGVEQADLEARELIACASGLEVHDMLRWKNIRLTSETKQKIESFRQRRQQQEPLAYILGEWDFYGNRFCVTRDVLIPRGDTEWLCDVAVQAAKAMKKPKILDLCCGSGCIGISIALGVPEAQVTLLDCSQAALTITRRNAKLYDLMEPQLTVVQGDALQPDSVDGIFDIVVSNPPYITAQEMMELDASVDAYEPHLALYGGTDGLDFYRAMAKQPAFRLKDGGKLFAECGWKQGQQVTELFCASGWKQVHLRCDLAGIPRIICAEYHKIV